MSILEYITTEIVIGYRLPWYSKWIKDKSEGKEYDVDHGVLLEEDFGIDHRQVQLTDSSYFDTEGRKKILPEYGPDTYTLIDKIEPDYVVYAYRLNPINVEDMWYITAREFGRYDILYGDTCKNAEGIMKGAEKLAKLPDFLREHNIPFDDELMFTSSLEIEV